MGGAIFADPTRLFRNSVGPKEHFMGNVPAFTLQNVGTGRSSTHVAANLQISDPGSYRSHPVL